MRTLRQGEWFGELSLLRNDLVSAFVVARTHCCTGMLPAEAWVELRRSHPGLVMTFKAAVEEMNYKALSPFATEVSRSLPYPTTPPQRTTRSRPLPLPNAFSPPPLS